MIIRNISSIYQLLHGIFSKNRFIIARPRIQSIYISRELVLVVDGGGWWLLPPRLPHNPGLSVVHAEPHHGGHVQAEVEEDKERDGDVEVDHLFGFFVLQRKNSAPSF